MKAGNKITVAKDGPYLVSGMIPLSKATIGVNADEESLSWVESDAIVGLKDYSLCRCGMSATKPNCDGTHQKIGFDGTETTSLATIIEQAKILPGPAT